MIHKLDVQIGGGWIVAPDLQLQSLAPDKSDPQEQPLMTTQLKITAMAATILAILEAPVSANLVVVSQTLDLTQPQSLRGPGRRCDRHRDSVVTGCDGSAIPYVQHPDRYRG